MQYGARRVMNQIAAIQVRDDLHSRRKDAGVQFLDLLVNPFERGFGLGAFAQQNDSFDDIVIIHRPPVVPQDGFTELSEADSRPLYDVAKITHANRGAVLRLQYGFADIEGRVHQPYGPDIEGLRPVLNEAPSGVHIVVCQRLLHLRNAQAVLHQAVRIELHLVLARDTPKAADIDHVRNRLELFFDQPVLDRFQLHRVVERIRTRQREKINLADGTVIGTELRAQVRRQAYLREFLQRLLAAQQIVGLFIEDQCDRGESEFRNRAQMRQMGDAVHLRLDRNRDLLLYFFGGSSGPLGDDVDVSIGNIRVRFNRERVKRVSAPEKESDTHRQNQEPVPQGEIDNALNHPWAVCELIT